MAVRSVEYYVRNSALLDEPESGDDISNCGQNQLNSVPLNQPLGCTTNQVVRTEFINCLAIPEEDSDAETKDDADATASCVDFAHNLPLINSDSSSTSISIEPRKSTNTTTPVNDLAETPTKRENRDTPVTPKNMPIEEGDCCSVKSLDLTVRSRNLLTDQLLDEPVIRLSMRLRQNIARWQEKNSAAAESEASTESQEAEINFSSLDSVELTAHGNDRDATERTESTPASIIEPSDKDGNQAASEATKSASFQKAKAAQTPKKPPRRKHLASTAPTAMSTYQPLKFTPQRPSRLRDRLKAHVVQFQPQTTSLPGTPHYVPRKKRQSLPFDSSLASQPQSMPIM